MKFLRPVVLALAAAGLCQAPAAAGPITDFVVFGDSLSDTGNVFIGTGGAIPAPPYFNGRFSNGPIWLDDLAAQFGVGPLLPSLAGGSNFAFGSAESGAGLSPSGAPNLLAQVGLYAATLPAPTPGTLFVVQAGGNDFLNGQIDPTVPVGNTAAAITTLAGLGGSRFAVPNLPDLGELPGTNTLPQPLRDALNLLSATYNALLAAELAQLELSLGVRIDLIDVNDLYRDIILDPAAFGFTNVTQGALNNGVLDGAGYLFWDDLHPTAAGHQLLADRAFGPLSVPEPASAVLLAAGGLVAAGLRRLRRAA